ncbi:anti-sigma factor domain-containing protein [Amycolatopsis sp. cmx-4-54]|uniref:anti-sigma factor n=1 Tax=Amycolatopsis sp. cmx-4-54 TaxID=2790936 RepID=UPI00397C87E0
MTTAEAHTLTGAYALDAVTDIERAMFTRHLAECPTCAQEVRELRETAARLGAAESAVPGSGLRARVLAEVSATRQIPPAIKASSGAPRRRGTRLAIVIASVAAAAAVLAGGISIGSGPAAAPVAASAPADLITVRAGGTGGGAVDVGYSRQRGEATIRTQGLPPLDGTHAYQAWLTGPRGAQSAGLVRADAGTLAVPLAADIDHVAITVEPAAGSPQPTTPTVFVLPLGRS